MVSRQTVQSKRKLNDGNEIPIVGFGTYEVDASEAYDVVTWALEAGYRHIDSAEWYENEAECGRAIREFCTRTGTARSDIFFTTKLKHNSGFSAVQKSINKSLEECGLGYIDLYLMHGPLGEPHLPGPQARKESWKAICEAKKDGKVRSIGISTFGMRHMKEILDMNIGVPAIHQIDLHPFMTRKEIVSLCQKHEIVLEAWGPLVRGQRFNHPKIVVLAKKYNKEPAQVLLRYSLEKGYVPLPKTTSKKRVVSNADLFDFSLASEEVAELDELDEYLITDWDPTDCS